MTTSVGQAGGVLALRADAVDVAPQLHYVDGTFRAGVGGRTFETLDPATNRPIAEVAEGLADDVGLAAQAARRAFDEGSWPRLPASERATVLRRIAAALREH